MKMLQQVSILLILISISQSIAVDDGSASIHRELSEQGSEQYDWTTAYYDQILADEFVCLNNRTAKLKILSNGYDVYCRVKHIPNPKIRSDYTHIQGIGMYKLHTLGKTWNQARKICESEGARLAVINSKAEHKAIIKVLKKEAKYISNAKRKDMIWLGVHNLFGNEDWITVSGEPFSANRYVFWSKGCDGNPPEPNNEGGNEHCLTLFHKCDQGLNDFDCRFSLAFVCEMANLC